VTARPQTAIRGVFSVAAANLAARVVAYGKHILITAYIGLSAELDAFYMATSVLSLAVFVFGDIFESLGVPRLVAALRDEGEEAFRNLAGSILTFALILSCALCAALYAAAPWTAAIAPGFDAARKDSVVRNLVWLGPMAALYLPYHAAGSILRARRRFLTFYLGETIIAATTFLVILVWHDRPAVVPLSFSAAYVVVFAYAAAAAARHVRFPGSLRSAPFRAALAPLPSLIPLYLTGYLFTIVDRAFASFLPAGGVSALSYGLLIATIPTSLLMMDAIFMTPLAEATDREPIMGRILAGTLIVSVPVATFLAVYAGPIVRAAFERGAFIQVSTRQTAEALRWFAAGLPGMFFWPVCYRLFQILERFRAVVALALAAVGIDAVLNYVFLRMGMGVGGIALATSITFWVLSAGAAAGLGRFGIRLPAAAALQVFLLSAAASAAALGAAAAVPLPASTTAGLLARGAAFAACACFLLWVAPHPAVRDWRDTIVRELAPWFPRR